MLMFLNLTHLPLEMPCGRKALQALKGILGAWMRQTSDVPKLPYLTPCVGGFLFGFCLN